MSGSPDGDPRAARTKASLREALLLEAAERPLAQLNVSGLARRAGVGRATFYLHYPDLQALAVDACADIVHQAVDALHAWRGTPDPAVPPPALIDFFGMLSQHGPLYRTLLHAGGTGPLGDRLHAELRERSRTERELAGAPAADLVASAVAGAFTAVLADWLHGTVDGSGAEVAGRIWRLLISLHRTPAL